jgi:hypothetical protein
MKTVILNEPFDALRINFASEESLMLWYAVIIGILHAKFIHCVAKGFTSPQYDNFMRSSKLADGVIYLDQMKG